MALSGECSHTYPTDITFTTEWCDVGQSVDYGSATSSALMTFESMSRGACPVRTGNLLSSIYGAADDGGFSGGAGADYAEYVEYGTWKMAAQPFFVDAFEAAGEECAASLQLTLQETVSELQAIAMGEIEEHYQTEYEQVYAEYEIMVATAEDPVEAEVWLLAEEQNLQIKMMVCMEQVAEQAETYLGQGTVDIMVD